MADLTRRGFLGFGAAAAGAMAAMAVGCTPAEEKKEDGAASNEANASSPSVEASSLTGWTGTPAEIAALGGCTMPLEDLNEYRRKYVESQTDYTCEDGTVIPAAYVKARALIHTYGMGCGNTPVDSSFQDSSLLKKFTEDEALAFVEMPWGVAFTPIEFAAKSGRGLDECKEIADKFADGGYLCRFETANGTTYHQIPFFQGVVEYNFTEATEQPGYNVGIAGGDMYVSGAGEVIDVLDGGTSTFYAMPCDKSVVPDSEILPFDDVEKIIKSKNLLAIAPCYCRYTATLKAGVTDAPSFEDFATGQFEDYFSPVFAEAGNVARVETCLMMGTEAEYWMKRGWAREITQEQAIGYMKRSAEDGYILQSSFGKNTETICSCHCTSCGIISFWNAAGGAAATGSAQGFNQISHYRLELDADACAKCGICMNRCPVQAITMDGEDGLPQMNDMCFRCGQCAYVCPQSARKLVQRPEEEILELPQGFLADNNMKAAYRFEHGLIR